MNKFVIASSNYEQYSALFKQHEDLQRNFSLLYAGENPPTEVCQQCDVMLGEPSILQHAVLQSDKLKWAQSTWAGNNLLQKCAKRDYQLTGVKDAFGTQMAEYVLSYLLYFSRQIEAFNQLKQSRTWQQLSCAPLAEQTVGIMGFGSIGQLLAKYLHPFGIRICSLSKSLKQFDHPTLSKVTQFEFSQRTEFLQTCDVVIGVLPETAETIGLCSAEFFSNMKDQSIFINVGRGSLIDHPQSVIDALNSNKLRYAVLDVFEQEPLPSDHPYYNTQNLYISCHTAAVSYPKAVFEIFVDNAQRFAEGKTLQYLHDFSKGY